MTNLRETYNASPNEIEERVRRIKMWNSVQCRILDEAKPLLNEGGECNHYIRNTATAICRSFYIELAESGRLSDQGFQRLRFQALWSYARVRVFLNWLYQDSEAWQRYVCPIETEQKPGPNMLEELISQNQGQINKLDYKTRLLNSFVMSFAPEMLKAYYTGLPKGKEMKEQLLIKRGVFKFQ